MVIRFRPATITTLRKKTWSNASARPKQFFLTRDMTRQKFAKIQDWGKAFTIFGTPVYQEFLAGKRELTCTAWRFRPSTSRAGKRRVT